MSEGFVASPWIAMVFFRYCMRYKIESEKDRIVVFRRLVAKKKAEYKRDPRAFIEGKKVLIIKKENGK